MSKKIIFKPDLVDSIEVQRITLGAAPSEDNDAATKKYVDGLIQGMLTMIPYIEIEVGATPTASESVGDYYTHNTPTLNSVTLYVKKNSATNLAFSLWDTTNDKQVGKTLTETNINKSDNTLTFADLNVDVNTSRDFAIKYTYNGEDNTPVAEQTVNVGKFTLSFQEPSTPTVESNLSTLDYYMGQTASVTEITTNVTDLNSASSITKVELYKDGTKVGDTITEPILPYKFTVNDSVTNNTTYSVRVYFNERTGESITLYEASLDNTLSINFTHKPAEISLAGFTEGSFSKLNPQTISANSLTATFTKYSDKITKVRLVAGENSENQEVDGYDGDTYNDSSKEVKFTFSKANICSDLTLKAEAYNGENIVAESDPISLSFYAPYCYGFVDASKSFDDVNAELLGTLSASETVKTKITLGKPDEPKKFIYAVPGGTFNSVKDGANEENIGLFTNSTKPIEFNDGSSVSYQILMLKNASAAAVNLTFSEKEI